MCSPASSPLLCRKQVPEASARKDVRQDISGGAASPSVREAAQVLKKPEASLFSSWCVLTNTILGVGMLSLPWAVSTVGLGLGVAMLLGAGVLAALALHFLARMAVTLTGGSQGPAEVSFYGACMEVAPPARFVVDAAIAVKCFGVATSYLQVIGQLSASLLAQLARSYLPISAFLTEIGLLTSSEDSAVVPERLRRFMVLLAVLVIAPVVFHKRITKTSSQNLVAICAWLYVAALVIGYSLGFLPLPEEEEALLQGSPWQFLPPASMDKWMVASTLPIFIFSFTCHQNMFAIATELSGRSVARLDAILTAAIGTGMALYCAAGIGGYIRFGSRLNANFMLNLPQGPPVLLGEVWAIIAVVFTYPLQLHPCRRSLTILVSAYMGRFLERREDRILRRILTVCILTGTTVLAVSIKDLGLTLAFVGAVGSNTVVLIMPAFLFLRMYRTERGFLWYVALFIFCIGCVILPACLTAVVRKAVLGPSPSH